MNQRSCLLQESRHVCKRSWNTKSRRARARVKLMRSLCLQAEVGTQHKASLANKDVHDINMKCTVALRALSVYLREEDTQFFKTWNSEESEEPDISDTPVGILTVVTERSTSPVHFSPASTAIVVEDELVMMDIATFADAYVLLFGLVYALHLDYPKKLVNTFTFIQ